MIVYNKLLNYGLYQKQSKIGEVSKLKDLDLKK